MGFENSIDNTDNNNTEDMQYKVLIMHNFSNQEIHAIIRSIRAIYKDREMAKKQLVFARSTETSLKTKLGDLIEDMCGDHDYLMQNPPDREQKGTDPESKESDETSSGN